MEFCPKCGSRLEPKKSKSGKEATLVLACAKCGYKKPEEGEKIEQKVAPKLSNTAPNNSWQ
jgi:DNA-directed RNA polymerase subunit M/transcription elongation factor TFIIS